MDEKKNISEEERPVGEILEEEYRKQLGTERFEPEKNEPIENVTGMKIKIEQEIDLNKILMDIEKLRAEVDALKEIKFHADERIKELAENIGELRSLIFQRDTLERGMEIKVEKLDEAISDIKPENITKKLQEKEQAIEQIMVRIEKLEAMVSDISKKTLKVERSLENIRSLENLMEIIKEIDEKILKIDELKSATERDSAKAERFYMEMGKNVEEFNLFKERLEKLEEFNKELIRDIDEIKIKLDKIVTKEEMIDTLEAALKPPETTENIEELNRKKEEIETLLKQLESQYKKGIISRESYSEVVEKNKNLVEQIERDIKEMRTRERPENLIEWLKQIEDELKNLKIKTSSGKIELPDLDEIKTQISSIKEELERYKLLIENTFGVQQKEKLTEDERKIKELEIQSIKELLSNLEDEYREGTISEKTYEETKNRNIERLKTIESEIKTFDYVSSKEASFRNILDPIKEEQKNLTQCISKLKEEIEKIKIDKKDLEDLIKMRDEKIRELENDVQKIDELKEDIENLKRIKERSDIRESVSRLEEEIEELKYKLGKSGRENLEEIKETLELNQQMISEIKKQFIRKINELEEKIGQKHGEQKFDNPVIIE